MKYKIEKDNSLTIKVKINLEIWDEFINSILRKTGSIEEADGFLEVAIATVCI